MLNQNIPSLIKNLRKKDFLQTEYLTNLESVFNEKEPRLHAFLPERDRFQRLYQENLALEKKYPTPELRPLLFGLPIGVKDIFHVDGFPTQAGTKLPSELFTGKEADCVTELRKHGAQIFGKTVTTEFAYFAPGPTCNPHNLAHTPGGSSSGSAAAVAAGILPFAFGTQTIGSISRPASFCGVVGFKPSYDRISKKGVIPLAPSVDHIGFFTADINSAKLMAQLLCKNWISPTPLSIKPILGIPQGPYLQKASTNIIMRFKKIIKQLQTQGYEIKSVPAMPNIEEIITLNNTLVAAEASQIHQSWFAHYSECYHPKTAELIKRGSGIRAEEVNIARKGQAELRQQLTRLMEMQSIDLWLSPASVGVAPKGLENTGDPIMNLPWTYAGLPTITLPGGKNEQGLPFGVQISAQWYSDEHLLNWAVDLETQLTGG